MGDKASRIQTGRVVNRDSSYVGEGKEEMYCLYGMLACGNFWHEAVRSRDLAELVEGLISDCAVVAAWESVPQRRTMNLTNGGVKSSGFPWSEDTKQTGTSIRPSSRGIRVPLLTAPLTSVV
jgi:hypothetical protein